MKLIDPNKRYYKGNTHTHTTNSDGRKKPEDVLRLYKEHGYDFLVISDHWHTFPTGEFEGMRVLSGIEYDFEFARQVLHVVGVFPNEAAAEGCYQFGMGYRRLIECINELGGAAIAAHPKWSHNTPDFILNLEGVCAAEVYNSFSGPPWNPPVADASEILDAVAEAGRCLPWLAADDSHYYTGEQCMSWTMLQADELTPEGIIAALKRGSFYASQGPLFLDAEIVDGEFRVKTTPVARCSFISDRTNLLDRCQEGVTGKPAPGDHHRRGSAMTENVYPIHPDDHYIRCEIEDGEGRKAWTSPVAVNR